MRTLLITLMFYCTAAITIQAQSAWTHLTEINGQEVGYVYDLEATSDGLIYMFSGWDNPETEKQEFKQFLYQNNEWHEGVNGWNGHGHATAGRDGNLWFASGDSIARYDGTELFAWHAPDNINIYDLAVGPDGTAWCSSSYGVYCFRDSVWTQYTTDDGLVINYSSFITVSPDGIPWIRYGDPYQIDGYIPAHGVSCLQGDEWITYDTSDGLIDNLVHDIVFGVDGDVYVSYRVSGVSRYDGAVWQTVSNRVGFMLYDSDGRLWISYAEWLWMYNGISTSDDMWPDNAPEYLASTNPIEVEGKLWFGTYNGIAMFDPSVPTGIYEVGAGKPTSFPLLMNYPNPFNPTTTISFTLPEAAPVTLEVYSITGQKVATLIDETIAAGVHEATFSGNGLSSGIYTARFMAGNSVGTLSMLLLK